MNTNKKISTDGIDEYIRTFPPEVRKRLIAIRNIIRKAAPEAGETIKYGIPTFTLYGNLVHFGGFTRHIGFYPTPQAIAHFAKELSPYPQAKGSVQFPLDQPLPLPLIKRIILYRVQQLQQKTTTTKHR